MTDTLIQRLIAEAELFNIEGASDISILLTAAADALEQQAAQIAMLEQRATCGCGDQFTAHDPGTCGNCCAAADRSNEIEALRADAERYRWLRRTTNAVTSKGERIDVRNNPELWDSAIDAALRQDQPTKPNHFPDAGKMVQPAGEPPT